MQTKLCTVAQMREAERRAETEYGIPLADLMDNAGKGLARAALEMLPPPRLC
jgi:NAD(P)H-hydrate repair Nnr-like enzyme with NAD(P)H-hydrate epimerase domain